jgi:hypothetical protein
VAALVAFVAASFGVPCGMAWAFDWRPAQTVSDRAAGESDVAVSASGDAVAAWQADDGSVSRVEAAAAQAGDDYGPAQTLSPPGTDSREPRVAIDGQGGALVVWERYDGSRSVVDATFVPTGAQAGPLHTLADSANAFAPDVAPVGDGQFLVTWSHSDGAGSQVRAALWTSSGFGTLQTLSDAGAWAQDPRVAASPDGAAVVAWRRRTDTGFRSEAVTRSVAGAFGVRQVLSVAGADASGPALAVGPAGETIAAWRQRSGHVWRVAAATRAAGGVFGPAQDLSASGTGVYGPAVAAGPGGVAAVAWSRSNGGAYGVEAATSQAGGPLGPAQALSSPAESQYGPAVAIGPGGETMVAWYASEAGRFSVQAASRPLAGAFGPALRLSGPAENALEPKIAGSPEALALVWTGFEGTAPALRASGFAASAAGTPEEPPSGGLPGATAILDLRTPVAPIAVLDLVAPRISYFAVTPRFAVVPRHRARVARRVPLGGRLRFGLSEPAQVTIAISGRGGSAEGALAPRNARAGANQIRFTGRIGRRALSRDRHRATIVAVDAAGNRSARRSDVFLISKREGNR